MSLETAAEYKRRRRMQSTDFKLYESAKMQASRARKEAAENKAKAKAQESRATALAAVVEDLTAWPEMDGFKAAKGGAVMDENQCTAWKRGYKIGRRK